MIDDNSRPVAAIASGPVAAIVARTVRDALIVRARRDSIRWPDDVLAWLDDLDAVAANFRSEALDQRNGSGPLPRGARPGIVTPMSTTDAAALLGITPRGVVHLLHVGALPGRKVDGRWQVDTTAATALAEGRTP